MDDMYIDKMRKYENLCLSYMQKADQEYINNNFKHSANECKYLQKAADLRGEMARISIGSEQDFQKEKVRELNRRIVQIIAEIDPDYIKRKRQEKAQQNAKNNGKDSSKQPKASSGGAGSDVDDDEVNSWFKEMPTTSFDDVTGMHELKKKLQRCIVDSKREEIRKFLGVKQLRSYFFVGPPGCGKTFLISAFAHELVTKEYKFMSLVGSDILSKYVGDAEKTVTRVFEEAEKNAPCILFIDEIDGVCKNRSLPDLPEYAASITTAFLTGYNRIKDSDKKIIFIGATNYPKKVDKAMLDRVELINVPFPDKEGRVLKFQRELKPIPLADNFSFEDMGDLTDTDNEDTQYNYRDVERLCEIVKDQVIDSVMEEYEEESEAIAALENGEWALTRELFTKILDGFTPSPKKEIVIELKEWREEYDAEEIQ